MRAPSFLSPCLMSALAVGSCAPSPGPISSPASAAAAPVTRIAHRGAATVTGQQLPLPPEPYEVLVSVTDLPAGAALPMHRHPWPRYAYVERGRIEVRYEGGGAAREVGPGEVLIEAIDTWHFGQAVGPEPVRIIVIDHVPPGQTNFVPR